MTQLTDLMFASEDAILRGKLYAPDDAAWVGKAPLGVVVMAHGFSAVAAQLEPQARAFAAAGFAAFVYDNPGFGLSGGFPRQEVDPVRQVRGYRDAVSFVRTLPGLGDMKIALWGSSFSGGHVLQAAAMDRRVAVVISQAPFISGWELIAGWPHGEAVITMTEAEREARGAGAEPAVMPVVGKPDEPCALPGEDGYAYFTSTGGPTWKNAITISSLELARAHEPGLWIARIAPRPLLMIVADNDQVTPTDHAVAAFARAGAPKKLVRVAGGHFDVYSGAGFDTATAETVSWLQTHLT
ncbi:alpha/beta hydrolase [Phenylobacterium sp.]|uniref:alpha/beta hydrolase n=1 Tax=Phenylobacterium sp. TaxID=1871053 RepID=UPI00374DC0D5